VIASQGHVLCFLATVSEIVFVPGAELLGPLPSELQDMNVISAGIVTGASEPDAARMLLKYLTSPAAGPVIKAAGMEPGGS
jgi:molybdate transport system substrate-binding protein